MLKNGKLYGSIIPPDVNSLRIRDASLGDKITLQLIALTDHPVGKHEKRHEVTGDRDSGIDGSGQPDDKNTNGMYVLFPLDYKTYYSTLNTAFSFFFRNSKCDSLLLYYILLLTQQQCDI